MAHSSSDHLLELRFRFCELVSEIVSPISEQDHGARVFVVLDVDHCETHHFTGLVGIVKIENLIFLFVQLLVVVDNSVETIGLSINQSCLD